MDMRGSYRGVTGRDRDLMQIRYDVACSVQSSNRGPLMLVNFQAANLGGLRSQRRSEVGSNFAAHRGIDDVEVQVALADMGADMRAIQRQFVCGSFDRDSGTQ